MITKKTIFFLVLVFFFGWVIKSSFIDNPAVISVVGEGKVTTSPQLVKFTTTVFNSAPSSTQAIMDNRRLVQDLILVLKSSGVNESDIDTAYVRVLPPETTGVSGYQAVNSIDITLRNITEFDNLVVQLYNRGAFSISNIVFSTDNAKDLEKQAVDLAIIEAKQRGKELAKASGRMLGRMVSVTSGEVGDSGAVSGSSGNTSAAGAVNASPNQIEITRQASIVFELLPF